MPGGRRSWLRADCTSCRATSTLRLISKSRLMLAVPCLAEERISLTPSIVRSLSSMSSIKSMVGHLIGASGAVEAVALALTLFTGAVPPTINLKQRDPTCDLDYVPNTAREMPVKVAVSTSFGFGGQNAAIVMRRLAA